MGFADKDHMKRLNISELPEYFLNWDIDNETRRAVSDQETTSSPFRPFLGVVGLAPEQPCAFTTYTAAQCRRQSGLQAGHGRKHDLSSGHVRRRRISTSETATRCRATASLGGTAIECTLDKVDLTFRVVHETIRNPDPPDARERRGSRLRVLDADLTNAAYEALTEMPANLIGKLYDMTFQEALAMASLVVDEHVTQIVNGVRGVHAILPDGAINKKG